MNDKKKKQHNYNIIGLVFLVLGALCFFFKVTAYHYVDAQGVLHEPFFLVPLGYLFIFISIILFLFALKGRK